MMPSTIGLLRTYAAVGIAALATACAATPTRATLPERDAEYLLQKLQDHGGNEKTLLFGYHLGSQCGQADASDSHLRVQSCSNGTLYGWQTFFEDKEDEGRKSDFWESWKSICECQGSRPKRTGGWTRSAPEDELRKSTINTFLHIGGERYDYQEKRP